MPAQRRAGKGSPGCREGGAMPEMANRLNDEEMGAWVESFH